MVFIYGAGGHGKVILDIFLENGVEVGGFFDVKYLDPIRGYPILNFPDNFNPKLDQLFIGIGNNQHRKRISQEIKANYINAIHKDSIVSKYAELGEGTVVMGGALIKTDTFIGKHCIINSNSAIGHDCTLGDFIHIAPGSILCAGISIGEGSFIGARSTIIPNIKIGKNSMIGAGSVVVSDVPDNVQVVGNPARINKYFEKI